MRRFNDKVFVANMCQTFIFLNSLNSMSETNSTFVKFSKKS